MFRASGKGMTVKTYWLIVAHNPKMSVGGGGGVKLKGQ